MYIYMYVHVQDMLAPSAPDMTNTHTLQTQLSLYMSHVYIYIMYRTVVMEEE